MVSRRIDCRLGSKASPAQQKIGTSLEVCCARRIGRFPVGDRRVAPVADVWRVARGSMGEHEKPWWSRVSMTSARTHAPGLLREEEPEGCERGRKNRGERMCGKHRKREASRAGCVVIVVFTMPLLILLTALADQAPHLIG
ncbi:hypothetical protein [Amycolatopsis sp. cmx-4-61]|uniref:hypothetical protein n=1 Tax=Amycolatopsis sp. cmx-4-61 TaxID=2790937 RepID=UPI0039797C9C